MQNFFIVVDMQNDFVTGALGSSDAVNIVPFVKERLAQAIGDGDTIIFTRDSHNSNYLLTKEGEKLPVPHCIVGTDGWKIIEELRPTSLKHMVIDKPTFGSVTLAETIKNANKIDPVGRVTLVGLCTDICVISNAMLIKASVPEAQIIVDAKCTAGASKTGHVTALNAMKACHIDIENEQIFTS